MKNPSQTHVHEGGIHPTPSPPFISSPLGIKTPPSTLRAGARSSGGWPHPCECRRPVLVLVLPVVLLFHSPPSSSSPFPVVSFSFPGRFVSLSHRIVLPPVISLSSPIFSFPSSHYPRNPPCERVARRRGADGRSDRKSTRLNSSHSS